jgi:hypothetical protein
MSAAPPARTTSTSIDVHRRPQFLIPVLAGISSLVFAIVAGIWLVVPSTNAIADPDSLLARESSLLGAVLSPVSAAQVIFGLSVAGVVVAMVAAIARDQSIRRANALVGGFGFVFTVVVGIGMLSEVAIMMAGYLMALIVAAGAVVVGVQVARTTRAGRWVVAAALGAVVVVFTTGGLPVSALGDIAGRVWDLFGEFAEIALVLGLTTAALLWALAGGQVMSDAGVLDRAGRWVLRHRQGITILAAVGPVPYGLVRLTWLTPWPQGAGGFDVLPPDVRIWGLMLSSGAWVGMILTIGLIRPWGEVFPRWIPGVAGRSVPVWIAAGSGALVAAILCVSAVPMIRQFATEGLLEALGSALVFPLWCWGPALALAVWGYALHRRNVASHETRGLAVGAGAG